MRSAASCWAIGARPSPAICENLTHWRMAVKDSERGEGLIRIEIDDRQVRQVLARLHAHFSDMRPFYPNVGEELVQSRQERLEAQQDPEGRPWKGLLRRSRVMRGALRTGRL